MHKINTNLMQLFHGIFEINILISRFLQIEKPRYFLKEFIHKLKIKIEHSEVCVIYYLPPHICLKSMKNKCYSIPLISI